MKITCNDTRVIRTSRVFPNDINNHHTLFGGKLLSDVDMLASISASRLCRCECVTASMDSVDFLSPIRQTDAVIFESFVTWTGKSSMEIFVKVIAEGLTTGTRTIAATAFLTFVALDDQGKPATVPAVHPETEEEKFLHSSAEKRAIARKQRRTASKEFAEKLKEAEGRF
ncbi:putative acyl-CoA thioester hydrolase [Bacillus sp. THAF10]|uniref:acyl-CoA thioesterase n=1 Tax=Bacillus sp. THAF10 TaxID=2587848 RepID=UPI0012679FF2|nr:acyl-CoA thioesterase [Bacillus sp. THAF10]QFT87771.1 putative acyl-CoA thioester hydrolase [Bacillus sp. THAF10]